MLKQHTQRRSFLAVGQAIRKKTFTIILYPICFCVVIGVIGFGIYKTRSSTDDVFQ